MIEIEYTGALQLFYPIDRTKFENVRERDSLERFSVLKIDPTFTNFSHGKGQS